MDWRANLLARLQRITAKSWFEALVVGLIVTVVGAYIVHVLKIGGGDVVQPLKKVFADDGRPVFEGGKPSVDGGDPAGAENQSNTDGDANPIPHKTAKPTVFCDTHSFYSAKDYIRIENDQFQCKHCGAVGTMENDPADGSMAFKFKPDQTPRKLPDYSGGLK